MYIIKYCQVVGKFLFQTVSNNLIKRLLRRVEMAIISYPSLTSAQMRSPNHQLCYSAVVSEELIKREVTSTNFDLCDEVAITDLDEDAAMWERRALEVCTALYGMDFMSELGPFLLRTLLNR